MPWHCNICNFKNHTSTWCMKCMLKFDSTPDKFIEDPGWQMSPRIQKRVQRRRELRHWDETIKPAGGKPSSWYSSTAASARTRARSSTPGARNRASSNRDDHQATDNQPNAPEKVRPWHLGKIDYKDTPFVGMATTKQMENFQHVPAMPETDDKNAKEDYLKHVRDMMHTAQTRDKLEWLMHSDTSEVELIISVCRRRLLESKTYSNQLKEIDMQIEKGTGIIKDMNTHKQECEDQLKKINAHIRAQQHNLERLETNRSDVRGALKEQEEAQ